MMTSHATLNIGLKQKMQICLLLDPTRIQRWHMWLADAVKAAGHDIILCRSKVAQPWPYSLVMLIELEKILYRLSTAQAVDFLKAGSVTLPSLDDLSGRRPFDLLIDCTGQFETAPRATNVVRPIYNASLSELAGWQSLIQGGAIEVGLVDKLGRRLDGGRVAIENRKVITKSLNNAYSRVGDLILKAIEMGSLLSAQGSTSLDFEKVDVAALRSQANRDLCQRVARKASELLSAVAAPREKWAVAWRMGAGVLTEARREEEGVFQLLVDDGQRYYADPFVAYHGGRHYLFVEEFPVATGKGIISASKFNEDGTLDAPRAVLEEQHHLSYPLVFSDGGQIWMIPECADSGAVWLYRSVDFPWKWERECILIDGIAGYDATLYQDTNCYWLFVTTRRWQSGTWDSLSIYWSERLRGPWRAHAENPVLLDSRSTRSGGHIIRKGTKIFRPAQYGADAYGQAINVCQIEILTKSSFRQRSVGRMSAKSPSGLQGAHTYNCLDGLEVVDVFGQLDGCSEVGAVYDPIATL